jgi:hypothetical protein
VLTKFVSPDDEHDVLETCRVKNKNKNIVKNCASRWSFTKNHFIVRLKRKSHMVKCLGLWEVDAGGTENSK